MRRRPHALLLGLLPLVSCGGPAPPPVQLPAMPLPTATQAVAPPGPDTSAVPVPKNVALVVRVANASASADRISRWTRLPLNPLALLNDDKAASVVDLSQPLDFAVAIEERRHDMDEVWAWSAAVRSLDEAKSAFSDKYDLVPGENGAVKVAAKMRPSKPVAPDDESSDDGDDGPGGLHCNIQPSFGTPYRLVCGESELAVGRLAAYLTRTVTRMPLTGDVHIEASSAPVRMAITQVRSKAVRELTRGLSGAPAVADLFNAYDPFELALDADHATVDAKLDDTGGDATLSIAFREKQSAWTKAIASHPERAEAPPATFMRLPGDADLALYTHGFDASELDKARVSAPDAVSQLLTSAAVSQSDATAFGNAVRNTITSLTGPLVYARGVDVTQARAAVSAYQAAKEDAKPKLATAAIEQVAGWEVIGLPAPISAVGPNVKEYAAVFGRPAFAKWLKDQSSDAPPTFRSAAAIPGLPADSLHFELAATHRSDVPQAPPRPGQKLAPKPAPKPPVVTKWHLLVVADQGRTWLIDAMDLPTAAAKAKSLLPGAPDTGTLAKRAGIDLIRSSRSNAGGFFNVRGIGMNLPAAMVGRTPVYEMNDDPLGGMNNPSQGGTLIPLVVTEETPPQGTAAVVTFKTHVPKEALLDFITVGDKLSIF